MDIRTQKVSRNTKRIVLFNWPNGDVENFGFSSIKRVDIVKRNVPKSIVGVWQPKGTKFHSEHVPTIDTSQPITRV